MIAMHEPGACMVCGDPTSSPSGVTCGLDCSYTWNGWRSRRDSMPRKYRVCQGCGEPYIKNRVPSSPDGEKYCSRGCASRHTPPPPRTPPTVVRTCTTCGGDYFRADSGADTYRAMYCSVECEGEGLADRDCLMCGKGFTPTDPQQTVCGDICRRRRERSRQRLRWEKQRQGQRYTPRRRSLRSCETCGDPFMADSNHRYCSVSCRPSSSSDGMGARLPYLLKRDGGRCKLCGKRVQAGRSTPHPMSPTVDHIIPRSKGGSDKDDNLQLAHFRCNIAKSNGSVGSQLLLIG